MTPDDPRHGTTRGFHAGCRERCCRTAIGRYEKATKLRRLQGVTWAIPALGTQRRIKALMALGWTGEDIANELGWAHRNLVRRILVGQKGKPCSWVERKTYRAVAETYERMAMKLPPAAPHRSRCRTMAARRGWLPPLAWNNIDDPDENPSAKPTSRPKTDVDPVVILRVIAGDRLPMTRAERVAVVAQARLLGWSEETIHARTGIAKATDAARYGERAAS